MHNNKIKCFVAGLAALTALTQLVLPMNDLYARGSNVVTDNSLSSALQLKSDISKTGIDNDSLKTAITSNDEDTAVDAGIYVEKNAELDDDFMMGMDISSYLSEINSGVVYYDYDGNEVREADFFRFLADCGLNWVRIRVWNDPYDADGNGYGGGNNDIDAAVTMGQWATEAGLKVFIDFHYSDFWADPSKQMAPKAWTDFTLEEKAEAVSEYTTGCLNKLIDAGVDVGMVQIGNETTTGICGVTLDESASTSQEKWADVCEIFKAGSAAVRAVDPDILIALHFTDPETSGRYIEIASALNKNEVDYDVFASSYYPYWHGELSNLKNILKQIASLYNKKVIIAETSYAYTYDNGDGSANTISADSSGIDLNYSVSVQGQAIEISDVVKTVTAIGDAGIGVFYWEGAWIPVNAYLDDDENATSLWNANSKAWEEFGSGWATSYAGEYDPDDAGVWYGGCAVENQALFDFYGNPLESLKTFKYLRTGTNFDAETLVEAEDVTAASVTGEEIILPSTVLVYKANGESSSCNVTWNQDELIAAAAGGAGTYKITGTVEGAELTTTCTLTVDGANLLSNAGFEDGTGSWVLSGNGVSITTDSSNVRTGKYCLKFWDDEAVEFTATQTVSLTAGTYTLKAYVEGGDCGDDQIFRLFVETSDGTSEAYAKVSGWQVWQNPSVTFTITSDQEVTVGVYVSAAAGGWGAWDDFHLSSDAADDGVAETDSAQPGAGGVLSDETDVSGTENDPSVSDVDGKINDYKDGVIVKVIGVLAGVAVIIGVIAVLKRRKK